MVTPSYETIHTYSTSFASCVLCIGLSELGKMSILISGYATEPTSFVRTDRRKSCTLLSGRGGLHLTDQAL